MKSCGKRLGVAARQRTTMFPTWEHRRLRRDHMTAGDQGRDHARTSMQWDGTPLAGFIAEGVRPWLPYGDNATRNVAAQRDNPGSVLRLCRDLIALRSAEFNKRITSYRQLRAPPGVWAFQAGRLQITVSFSDTPVAVTPAAGPVTASSTAGALASDTFAPWSGVIIRPAS